MRIDSSKLAEHNQNLLARHKRKFEASAADLPHVEDTIKKLIAFNVAIPSGRWEQAGRGLRDFQVPVSPALWKRRWKTLDYYIL
jgi:hypothetical protein